MGSTPRLGILLKWYTHTKKWEFIHLLGEFISLCRIVFIYMETIIMIFLCSKKQNAGKVMRIFVVLLKYIEVNASRQLYTRTICHLLSVIFIVSHNELYDHRFVIIYKLSLSLFLVCQVWDLQTSKIIIGYAERWKLDISAAGQQGKVRKLWPLGICWMLFWLSFWGHMYVLFVLKSCFTLKWW